MVGLQNILYSLAALGWDAMIQHGPCPSLSALLLLVAALPGCPGIIFDPNSAYKYREA